MNVPVCIIFQNESYIVSVYSYVLEGREKIQATENANFRDSETTADKHVISNNRYATTHIDACFQVTKPTTVDVFYDWNIIYMKKIENDVTNLMILSPLKGRQWITIYCFIRSWKMRSGPYGDTLPTTLFLSILRFRMSASLFVPKTAMYHFCGMPVCSKQ